MFFGCAAPGPVTLQAGAASDPLPASPDHRRRKSQEHHHRRPWLRSRVGTTARLAFRAMVKSDGSVEAKVAL